MMEGTIYLGVANCAARDRPREPAYFERARRRRWSSRSPDGFTPLMDGKDELPAHLRGGTVLPDLPPLRISSFQRVGRRLRELDVHSGSPQGGLNLDFEYDLDRPIESLAEGRA